MLAAERAEETVSRTTLGIPAIAARWTIASDSPPLMFGAQSKRDRLEIVADDTVPEYAVRAVLGLERIAADAGCQHGEWRTWGFGRKLAPAEHELVRSRLD